MENTENIQTQLQALGLSSTESEIYLTLFEYQQLSAGRISKLANIKRTTVYAACDELAKKNLIEINESGKQRVYAILSTSQLVQLVKKAEAQIIEKKKVAKGLIESFKQLPQSSYIPTPKIRIVPHDRIEDFLYKNTALWEESMRITSDATWWGIQDHSFVECDSFKKWIEWYWSRASKKYNLKLFSNESIIENTMKKKKIKKREIRFWEGGEVTATLWVLGEYIVSINTTGKKHYLIQTHDALLAQNLRNTYRKLWNS